MPPDVSEIEFWAAFSANDSIFPNVSPTSISTSSFTHYTTSIRSHQSFIRVLTADIRGSCYDSTGHSESCSRRPSMTGERVYLARNKRGGGCLAYSNPKHQLERLPTEHLEHTGI